MKHTQNNEIDLLLRRLAKRGEVSSMLAGAPKDPALLTHLDADELSSYAEGALPSAARSRYAAHLADCSSCRKIVTDLTMASGVSVRENEMKAQTGAAFWQKFRALLSLPVLRYAIPALALLAVMTVGIISFKQLQERRSETGLVAQNQEPSIPEAVRETPQSTPSAEPETRASSTSESKRVAGTESAGASADSATKAGEKSGVASKTDLLDSTYPTQAKDSPKPGTTSNVAAQPSFAPEPTVPPAAHTETVQAADARKNEETPKRDIGKLKEQTAERDELTRAQRNEPSRDGVEAEEKQETLSKSRKAAAAARGGGGLRTMEARRADGEDAKKADEDTEIRAIAGRRFRRRGNAWIDTAYEPSRPAITIVRDSEQYRALIADEPGIRNIAEKLHGEVVLVWKGRAYRIR